MPARLGTRASAAITAAALATVLATATPASAASPVGPDGQIHGCYVAKGKKKGALRLLAPGKKCKKRKREKPVTWSVQGPAGTPGAQGPAGPAGLSGISTEQLSLLTERITQQDATIESLQTTVTALLTQVGALQAVLSGITNGDLTGARDKLNGISGTELQSAVDAVADVGALCTRVGELTSFGNDLRTVISGIALGGTIPPALTLTIPGLPAALGAFACP